MRDHLAGGEAGDDAGLTRIATIRAAIKITRGKQVTGTCAIDHGAKWTRYQIMTITLMTDEGTVSPTRDDGLFNLPAECVHGRLGRTVTQACRLIFIGEQDIDMIMDKPTKRLTMPFGTPGVRQ